MIAIGLTALPIVLALYTNGANIQAIPSTLTSGIFPIAFTVLSCGLAARLVYKLRK